MGCFVSTNKRASTSPREDHAEVPQPPKPSERSIAPSHADEEKVKEVLSVTTATKSESQKQRQNKVFSKLKEEEQSKDEKKPLLLVPQEETSEVSEVCSLISDTVSISTTTTTATEHREDAQETRKRVNNRSLTKPQKNRSFTGDHGTKKEKTVHASRNGVGSARLTHCRDQIGQRIVNGGTRNQPHRRDPGETSFRRPATRADDGAGRSVVRRCPSARRTNGSLRTAAPENSCRKMDVPVREGKWDYTSNETLENPLVSLECFIFI